MHEILKKRIEAAARYVTKSLSDSTFKEACKLNFENGASFALSSQWISVEEALPELMERVLVAYRLMNRTSICIMRRIPHDTADPDNGKWHWSLVNHKKDVIAWMPIPEL